jgi:hypothetical protein
MQQQSISNKSALVSLSCNIVMSVPGRAMLRAVAGMAGTVVQTIPVRRNRAQTHTQLADGDHWAPAFILPAAALNPHTARLSTRVVTGS